MNSTSIRGAEMPNDRDLAEVIMTRKIGLSKPRSGQCAKASARDMVANLHAALAEPEARAEAAEVLRGSVERINVWSGRDGQQVELIGDIVKLVTLPRGVVCDI